MKTLEEKLQQLDRYGLWVAERPTKRGFGTEFLFVQENTDEADYIEAETQEQAADILLKRIES